MRPYRAGTGRGIGAMFRFDPANYASMKTQGVPARRFSVLGCGSPLSP